MKIYILAGPGVPGISVRPRDASSPGNISLTLRAARGRRRTRLAARKVSLDDDPLEPITPPCYGSSSSLRNGALAEDRDRRFA